MTDENKKSKDGTKKGNIDISRLRGKTQKGKKTVFNMTTIEVIKRMVSNTTETSNFCGRLVADNQLPKEHVIITCHDCSYAVAMSPEVLFEILKSMPDVDLLNVWTSKQVKWESNKPIAPTYVLDEPKTDTPTE